MSRPNLLEVVWEAPWDRFERQPETYRLLLGELVLREGQPPACDICPTLAGLPPTILPKGKVPVVRGVFIVSKISGHAILPPFALCPECQLAMQIEPGDTAVHIDRFKHRWLKGMVPGLFYFYQIGG